MQQQAPDELIGRQSHDVVPGSEEGMQRAYFAVTRERLRVVAKQWGVHHLANLGGSPAG
jgi:hypothetical protein